MGVTIGDDDGDRRLRVVKRTTPRCLTLAEINTAAVDFVDNNDASRNINEPDAVKSRLFLGMFLIHLKRLAKREQGKENRE